MEGGVSLGGAEVGYTASQYIDEGVRDAVQSVRRRGVHHKPRHVMRPV